MKKNTAILVIDVVVLLSLVLGGAMPAAPARALDRGQPALAKAEPGAAVLAAPAEAPSAPTVLPPLELTVTDAPVQVPFKLDLETMLGPNSNTATWHVDRPVSWQPTDVLQGDPPPMSKSNVAAVPVGGERILAVWHDLTGKQLRARLWWPGSGDVGVDTELGLEPKGNPILISLTPEEGFLLARDADDFVQYRWWAIDATDPLSDPWEGTWQEVPGDYRVGSDLAAVAKASNHITVFFRDAGGDVMFTEWQAGACWRSQPVKLDNPGEQTDNPGIQIVSELAAVSRSDRHLAVFGIGQDNVLYTREWTSKNSSD